MKTNRWLWIPALILAAVMTVSESSVQAAAIGSSQLSDLSNLSDFNLQENLTTDMIKMKKALKKPCKKTYRKLIYIGETARLQIKDDLGDYDVSFKSSKDDTLDVKRVNSTTCNYTGVSSGSANIVIKIKPKYDIFFWNKPEVIRAKITVSPRAASIKFRKSKYKLKVGQKKTINTIIRPSITKEKPVFASMNPKIATFVKGNTLLAKSPGKTFITATINNKVKTKCKVIVKNKKKK